MALPSNTTTYGDISPRTAVYAKKRLLERGQHLSVAERFGQKDPQPRNASKTVKWRRYNSVPRVSSPLSEGVPPSGHKLTYTDVTATLEQYGDVYKITDVIVDTHEDNVLMEAMGICGEQVAETIEEVRINFLKAGTNVYYAGGAASRSVVNSPPTRGDFRKIYRSFKKYKAREISEIISASAKISTEPVEAAYFVMSHTDLDADFRGISGFVPSVEYSDSSKRLPGEIGKVEQFRIILTAMFDPWEAAGAAGTTYLSGRTKVTSDTACDVYPVIVVARDSYGIVPLQGHDAVKPMVVNPHSPDKFDPTGQIGFVSWITYQAGAILNQLWIARLECAATAEPA